MVERASYKRCMRPITARSGFEAGRDAIAAHLPGKSRHMVCTIKVLISFPIRNLTMSRMLVVLLLMITASRQVAAQDIYPVYDMGILTGTLANDHNTQAAQSMARKHGQPQRRDLSDGEQAIGSLSDVLDGKSRAPVAVPAVGRVKFTYPITPALQTRAVSDYIERIGRNNPEAAKAMRLQFARQDYPSIYNGMIRGSHLSADDAADALTFYTLIGWQIANKNTAEISDVKVDAVRRQLAAALSANHQISSPVTRAALGEEMKLLALTLHAGWQSAMREGKTQRYSDGVAAIWKNQTGHDLRAVKLSEAGFSRR